MARFLSPEAAQRYYDRFGAKQDTQAFYEDAALDRLVEAADLAGAENVFEFGCGTGRLAERLLAGPLPETARYAGCDLSKTMTGLARARLARFGDRVTLWQSGPAPDFAPGGPPFDRILTSYVLDLLPPERIAEVLAAARAALAPGGRFCAASLSVGEGFPAGLVTAVWQGLYRMNPAITGGCRPLRLAPFFAGTGWRLLSEVRVTAWGVTSEVIAAEPA